MSYSSTRLTSESCSLDLGWYLPFYLPTPEQFHLTSALMAGLLANSGAKSICGGPPMNSRHAIVTVRVPGTGSSSVSRVAQRPTGRRPIGKMPSASPRSCRLARRNVVPCCM